MHTRNSLKLRKFLNQAAPRDCDEYQDWLKNFDPDYVHPNPSAPLSADDWQEFKKKFVSEYDGKPINPHTGMSDKEFLDYVATGRREYEDTHAYCGLE